MENCVAPGLDEFDVIIRSCIVFSQSIPGKECLVILFYKTVNELKIKNKFIFCQVCRLKKHIKQV